jgi:hypothetical protein
MDQPCAPFRFPSVLLRLAPPRSSSDPCAAVWSFASAHSSVSAHPARRSRTHTWIPVFPSRKKKFQCLEVSAQDSVARQSLIPRAPHPINRASSYINRFRCRTRNRGADDATGIVSLPARSDFAKGGWRPCFEPAEACLPQTGISPPLRPSFHRNAATLHLPSFTAAGPNSRKTLSAGSPLPQSPPKCSKAFQSKNIPRTARV